MNISACAAWAPGLGDLTAWRSWPDDTQHPQGARRIREAAVPGDTPSDKAATTPLYPQGARLIRKAAIPGDTPSDKAATTPLPADDTSAPDIRFVNALLRRRLGRLSRMALHVANEAATGLASLSTIFASRHGELSRTVGILHALAANEAPSPTAFSLSVHNSAAGIFSIFRADRAPSTALAAGEETLLWALQDAAIRLASDPDTAILLVYADEPLPGEYGSSAAPGDLAHAVAFLLAPGEGLSLEWGASRRVPPSQEPLSMAILANFLGHRDRIEWHGERLSVHGFCHA